TVNKPSGRAILGAALTHPSTFTVFAGTLDLTGNNLTVTNLLAMQNGGTLQLQGGESVSTPVLNSGSTVIYNGTSGPYNMKNFSYHHIIVNGSGATFRPTTTLTAAGDMTVS